MARFDTWENYFYPETYDGFTGKGVLRNVRDIRAGPALRSFEYRATARRARELRDHPELTAHTYDAAHVRAIHRHLFQDVYEWAGKYRTVNMSKGMSSFADVHSGQIDRYLGDVHKLVAGTRWERLDHDAFAATSAHVFAYLNQAHPFREGNGRTSKVFMEQVADPSRFTFDFARVTPKVWNNASMLSGPDRGTYEPVPDSLLPVFRVIAVERTGPRLSPSRQVRRPPA